MKGLLRIIFIIVLFISASNLAGYISTYPVEDSDSFDKCDSTKEVISKDTIKCANSGTIHCIILYDAVITKPSRIELFKYKKNATDKEQDTLLLFDEYISDTSNNAYFVISDLQSGTYRIHIPAPRPGLHYSIVDSIRVINDSASIVICPIERVSRAFIDHEYIYPYKSWIRWIVTNTDSLWKNDIYDSIKTWYYNE